MWAGVNGNHDDMDRTSQFNGNHFFRNVNANPENGYRGQEGVCYYTRLGDLLLIALNSEAMRSPEGLAEAQEWVKKVIMDNPARYTAVMEHYQWFYGEQGNTSQFSRWNKLFDKYEVDLALGANNHIYVATPPVYNGTATEPGHGTVYIQTPSSDNERGVASKDLTSNTDLIKYRWTEGPSTVGAILMNVTPEQITLTLYNRNGDAIDENIIMPRIPTDTPATVESVGITRPEAVSPQRPFDITFSRRMDRESVDRAISVDNGGRVSTEWINDFTVRIDPAELTPRTTYTLVIDGSTARNSQTHQLLDGDGDGVEGGDFSITFTMAEPDNQPPCIVNTTPAADGAAEYTARPVIGIEFDEEIEWDDDAMAHMVTVTDSDGNTYAGQLRHDTCRDRSFLQYYFDADLPRDRTFLVTVKAGITDLCGNAADAMHFRFMSEYRPMLDYTTALNLNTLSDFWAPGQSGSSKGVIAEQSGVSTSPLASSTDPANTGSLKMTYAFDPDAATKSWVIREYWSKSSSKTFPGADVVVTAWVYGDACNNDLCMLLRANSKSGGLKYRDPMQPLDWLGWRLISFDLANDPIAHYTGSDTFTDGWHFDSFYIKHTESNPGEAYRHWSGVLHFDEVAYSHWDESAQRQARPEDIDLPAGVVDNITGGARPVISRHGNIVSVTADNDDAQIYIYTLAGTVAAHASAASIDITALPAASYVAKAVTRAGTATAKIIR
ncbi:MAG: Ig-like domain-containing protein [Muribaculaceae bacterium]|nr:Ig-like domain-containing protein [Muribaculaceae bacterium]